jgi:hypothetical protein
MRQNPSAFDSSISLDLRPGRLYLVLAPRPLGRRSMNAFAARLALAGGVRVLDCGNIFDALAIARQVRRQTEELETILERLSVARAFTCYQVLTLLAETTANSEPTLVMDLLSTFSDENVNLAERYRLLEQAIAHLRRLSQLAPVAVSAAPLEEPALDRPGHAPPLPAAMLEGLELAADQVLRFVYPDQPVQGKLWS